MTTVASRTFVSTPARESSATWTAVVDMLTQGKDNAARKELLSVTGIAASVIADHAAKDEAIVVTCDGPRTRVYCIYDDDAIDGSDANEDALGFDPLSGDWKVSLPCLPDDLGWVQNALKTHSERITARALGSDTGKSESNTSSSAALVLDEKGFLGS